MPTVEIVRGVVDIPDSAAINEQHRLNPWLFWRAHIRAFALETIPGR